jgi:hypothetical protein
VAAVVAAVIPALRLATAVLRDFSMADCVLLVFDIRCDRAVKFPDRSFCSVVSDALNDAIWADWAVKFPDRSVCSVMSDVPIDVLKAVMLPMMSLYCCCEMPPLVLVDEE